MVASSVDAKTRAVAVSQVDYLTGFRIDPWAFREASGDALLVIDAIQAAGAVGVGLAPADVVVTGAHKWLRGGLGIAVMAVSDRALERLEPTLSGWTAVTDFLDFNLPQPREFLSGAARFLMSAPPLGAVPGMVAALDVLESAGIETIEEAVLERAMLAETVLRSAGAEVMAPWRHHGEHAGIVSFRMPNQTAGASFEALKAGGYLVALRGPWLRVSTHATSDPAQIEGLKQALS
jgi:selenocysteine lyase/cysteine desulfurase